MLKEIKLAIVGSRSIKDYNLLKSLINLFPYKINEIISGGAEGVDKMARLYALENSIPLTEYLPNWFEFKKSAGMIRNKLILKDCDYALILWDGISKGTKGDVEICK